MAKKTKQKKEAQPKQRFNQMNTIVHKEEADEDQFDFGGLPKNVPFKRNIGCGG